MFGTCFVIQYFVSSPVLQSARAGCFTLIVFMVSCECKCSVTFLHGAVSWTAVCDCSIS